MRRIVAILGIATALVTGVAFLGRLWWVFDLLAHFRMHLLVWCVLLVAACLALRAKPVALAAAVLLLLNLAEVIPAYTGGDADPGTPRLRVLVANVHTANADHAALLRRVDETDPDVIALVEVDDAWMESLATLQARYPHRIAEPAPHNFGVALFSRRPLAAATVLPLDTPAIRADLGGVDFFLVHPMPPISGAASAERDRVLAAVTRLATPTTMICGDFNATPWSHAFPERGLRDSRRGFGNQATWPSWLGPAGIPIDHCVVGRDLAVTGRRVLGDIGSDHRPILVDVAPRSPTARR